MPLGRKIDEILDGNALQIECGGTRRKGLCRRGLLSWHLGGRDGTLLDRPDRFACNPVEDKTERLFRYLCHRLDRLSVNDGSSRMGAAGMS